MKFQTRIYLEHCTNIFYFCLQGLHFDKICAFKISKKIIIRECFVEVTVLRWEAPNPQEIFWNYVCSYLQTKPILLKFGMWPNLKVQFAMTKYLEVASTKQKFQFSQNLL